MPAQSGGSGAYHTSGSRGKGKVRKKTENRYSEHALSRPEPQSPPHAPKIAGGWRSRHKHPTERARTNRPHRLSAKPFARPANPAAYITARQPKRSPAPWKPSGCQWPPGNSCAAPAQNYPTQTSCDSSRHRLPNRLGHAKSSGRQSL